jgi:hypothetical protein
MSIKNLEYTGLKNQDIVCKDLDVKGSGTFENLQANNFVLPDPLLVNDLDVQGNLIVGTIANNNILDLNISEQNYNKSVEIEIKDGLSASYKVVDEVGDEYMILDSSTGSKKIQFDKPIEILNNHTINSTGEILVSSSKLINSVGNILIAFGLHTFIGATPPTLNRLSIPLDGDNDVGYELRCKYNFSPTSVSFALNITLNNDTSNEYAYRRIRNGSSTASNNVPAIPIDFSTNQPCTGVFNIQIATNRLLTNTISGKLEFSTKTDGLGNNPDNIQSSIYYENTAMANITSIELDISDVNYLTSSLTYRLVKLG